MRPDVETVVHKLATKKLADRYIGRHGEPPSLIARRKSGTRQDLNDDDRKHLKWCIRELRGHGRNAVAALDFIEAVLDRDYGIYRGEEQPIREPT